MDEELKKVLAEGDIDKFGRTRLINLLEHDSYQEKEQVWLVQVGHTMIITTIVLAFSLGSLFSALASLIVEETLSFAMFSIGAVIAYFASRRVLQRLVCHDWECRKRRLSTVFGLVMLTCIFVLANSLDSDPLVADASVGVMCGFCVMHATFWLGRKLMGVFDMPGCDDWMY